VVCSELVKAKMEALNAKLQGHSRFSRYLDLSGINLGAEEAKTVASFLPQW
jgi:hypothetical protein